MTQRPSGSPNAGRINCFPTKTSQSFLSQPSVAADFVAADCVAVARRSSGAGGGDDPWLVDTAGIGAGKAERKCVRSESGSECPLLALSGHCVRRAGCQLLTHSGSEVLRVLFNSHMQLSKVAVWH